MRISDLKIGQKARIISLEQGPAKSYRQRLIAMGLLPGAEFSVSRIAPLGDPVEILIRGFALSIRKGEANILHVQLIS
jgi:ferrous iron transport protein A